MAKYILKQAAIFALTNEANTHSNPVKRAYTRAAAIIEQITAEDVQPVKQWISVRDRFPETPEEGLGVRYSDCCLVCDSHDWCGMAYYLTDDKKSWWEFADAQNKVKIDWTEITHWMPLPEPPKEDWE